MLIWKEKKSGLKYKLRPWALALGFGGLTLALLTASVLDLGFGQDVRITQPHDPTVVELNQAMFNPGDPVADIYGNAMNESVRVIWPNSGRIVRPPEDPSLVLLMVDKLSGENPLQAQTIWFLFKMALIPLVLVGVGGLFLPKA